LTGTPAAGIVEAMDAQGRGRAEARLEEAAGALGLADPRGPLRERLRQLRESDPAAFERAVQHYEGTVLPALAGDDPIAAWLEYGRFLGQLRSNGRLTAIDSTGRATVYRPPLQPASLVLFMPEDTAVEPLVAAAPQDCTPAQQATLDLLVRRRLALES
jgi:hypothetical protein